MTSDLACENNDNYYSWTRWINKIYTKCDGRYSIFKNYIFNIRSFLLEY